MAEGSHERTPRLTVDCCPSPADHDAACEGFHEAASVPSTHPPHSISTTDRVKRKRRILSRLLLFSFLPFRTSPCVMGRKNEEDKDLCKRNNNLSNNRPSKMKKRIKKSIDVTRDAKLSSWIESCPSNRLEKDTESYVPLTSKIIIKRRNRLRWCPSNGYKTVLEETQTRLNGQVSCDRFSQTLIPGTKWPYIVQGLQSVLLILVMSLLSPVGAFCPRGCVCDVVRLQAQCVSADLDVVPILLNPATLELNLSHNKIKTILDGFNFYDVLQYLDLAHNEVVSLGSQNFANQRALHTLIISNNKVSKIHSRAFLGLLKLTTLDLSDNYIETVEKNAFGSLNKLKILDLSNNRIKNLTINTFSNLYGLRMLNLCKNELRHVYSEAFEPLRELQELDLCSNQIMTIQNFAFKNLKGLIVLKLSNNKMFHIHEKAFSGLNSLKFLSLKDNAFAHVPNLVFVPIGDLEELDFSINPVKSLPYGPFIHVPKLRSLHISRCENLSSVDSRAFASLSLLTTLTLSFNPQIISLHTDVFSPLSSLKHLVLRGNGLRTFDQSLVSSTILQSLDLRDNSLECNCSIKWLQEACLNNSLSLKIEEILCAGPELLKGRSLSELSEYDLECYNNVLVVASSAAASLALVLLLVAFGIVYYKNCRKMKAMVHDHWPEKIVATWKDPEYQKQQFENEEYTFHSLRGVQHIPVTVI